MHTRCRAVCVNRISMKRMNSRRRLLQFLGLGSLFATTGAATINQARAAHHLKPISPGFVADETHTIPVRRFRVVDGSPFRDEKRSTEKILEDTEKEGWHFRAVSGCYGDQFIFDRLEWPEPEA